MFNATLKKLRYREITKPQTSIVRGSILTEMYDSHDLFRTLSMGQSTVGVNFENGFMCLTYSCILSLS